MRLDRRSPSESTRAAATPWGAEAVVDLSGSTLSEHLNPQAMEAIDYLNPNWA